MVYETSRICTFYAIPPLLHSASVLLMQPVGVANTLQS
jgi:hypothetical protein